MRVLHVHRIAHIPQLLVRELEKNGIEAEFVEEVGTSEKIVTGSPGASSTIVANIRVLFSKATSRPAVLFLVSG